MGANCFGGKKGESELPAAKKNTKGSVPLNGAQMDRVTE